MCRGWCADYPKVWFLCSLQQSNENKKSLKKMSANEKAQKRVNIMVGFMITAFIVAWTPYSIVSLMETFAEESGGFQISPGAATIPSLFAKGSIVFNPLIYGVFNTQVGYSRPPFSPPLPPHPPNFYIMAISKCG